MSLTLSLIFVALIFFWYFNRHKPLKHIVKELRNTLYMQGAGIFGIIDDWLNKTKNMTTLPDAKGRIAVITGGERGIGAEVIKGLLKANMIVVMGVERTDLAKKTAETLENGENLHVFNLDLLSLKSVKQFADNVLNSFPEIHLLINNAGVMFDSFKLSKDGFESLLAVNHLGHFYLTHLLLSSLKKGSIGECSRVVNVSSCVHYIGEIFFEDINMTKYYDTSAAYSQAKLAQLMSTRYINKLLEEKGDKVKCYAVHPGVVNTDLINASLWKRLLPWAIKLVFKSPPQGAISILHACFSKELEKKGGLYISNCIEGISSQYSKNEEYQEKLFDISCNLVKINKYNFGVI